jgi:tetratricopeptide (TPR) repeat protein
LKVQLDLGGQLIDREKYSLVLAFFPFHAEAYYQRGLAHLQFRQFAEALDDFTQAILLNPGHAGAYHRRALVNTSCNDFQAARADFGRVLELRPGLAAAYAGRAYTGLQLERYREALADFARAEALSNWDQAALDLGEAVPGPNPGKAIVAYWLAVAHLGAGDPSGYRLACAAMARRFA